MNWTQRMETFEELIGTKKLESREQLRFLNFKIIFGHMKHKICNQSKDVPVVGMPWLFLLQELLLLSATPTKIYY